MPAERRQQNQAFDALGLHVRQRQRHGPTKGFTTYPDAFVAVCVQNRRGTSGESLDAALGQVEVVVEGYRLPVRKERRRGAHEQSRMAVQTWNDEHLIWPRRCHAPMFYAVCS